jgi:PAS domain S-box-containing protein
LRRRFKSHHPIPPLTLGVIVAMLLIAVMAVIRLGWLHDAVLPIGFGVPIVVIAYFRSRALLWGAALAFTAIVAVNYLAFAAHSPHMEVPLTRLSSGLLVELDLLLVAAMGHIWIVLQEAADARNRELAASNAEMASREEEIARQNEELQSQTEELERQSEELRATNEQIERRERTLEALLSLSRALTTEMTQSDMMLRICKTLNMLSEGDVVAAAILEVDGKDLHIVCHHGFGPEGPLESRLPFGESFASLILSRGRTGYLEDVSQRPDLRFPHPKNGTPFSGVLAVPLRVGGAFIGTLEAYSGRKTSWTERQVVLIESLAAQASISMEAARLFESAQREKQRLETVLNVAPLPLVIASADGLDIRVNPAAAALFRVPIDINVASMIGTGSWRLVRNGQPVPLQEVPIFRAARGGEEIQREEFEQLTDDGQRRNLLVNARPIRDGEGKLLGAVASLVDITPQKQLQAEIEQRRREAEEASVRKTRFLAAVSHDVRTPANAIGLLADLIRRTASNPALLGEIPELAGELYSSSVFLVNLLTDVLDIARFDSGKMELQLSDFSLGRMMEEERDRLAPLARQKNLVCSWIAPAQELWLRADRIKLSRVLGNLVGNAVKFTEQGEITIDAGKSEDGGVRIRVADTGIGIAADHQRDIFDEFVQLRNPERDRTKGSGLGLAICLRLVEAMQGKLEVQSVSGKGSVFTVTLPANYVISPPQALPSSSGR